MKLFNRFLLFLSLAASGCASPASYFGIDVTETAIQNITCLEFQNSETCYRVLSLADIARLAQANDKLAQLELATRFDQGRGVTRDPKKAKKLRILSAGTGPSEWVFISADAQGRNSRLLPALQESSAGPTYVTASEIHRGNQHLGRAFILSGRLQAVSDDAARLRNLSFCEQSQDIVKSVFQNTVGNIGCVALAYRSPNADELVHVISIRTNNSEEVDWRYNYFRIGLPHQDVCGHFLGVELIGGDGEVFPVIFSGFRKDDQGAYYRSNYPDSQCDDFDPEVSFADLFPESNRNLPSALELQSGINYIELETIYDKPIVDGLYPVEVVLQQVNPPPSLDVCEELKTSFRSYTQNNIVSCKYFAYQNQNDGNIYYSINYSGPYGNYHDEFRHYDDKRNPNFFSDVDLLFQRSRPAEAGRNLCGRLHYLIFSNDDQVFRVLIDRPTDLFSRLKVAQLSRC